MLKLSYKINLSLFFFFFFFFFPIFSFNDQSDHHPSIDRKKKTKFGYEKYMKFFKNYFIKKPLYIYCYRPKLMDTHV